MSTRLYIFFLLEAIIFAKLNAVTPISDLLLNADSDNTSQLIEAFQSQFIDNFKPCINKANFCKILCPTYCGSYFDKSYKYDFCNCTGCYCVCGRGVEGPRDAENNLQCYLLNWSNNRLPTETSNTVLMPDEDSFPTSVENTTAVNFTSP